MNRHERRKQAALQRRNDTQSHVPVTLLEGETRERFQAAMKSEQSGALFNRICHLLVEWNREHPGAAAGLEWHLREGDKLITVGPLGEPEAQKHLAKNDAAMALLDWLDEQTGGEAMTLHARIALEYCGFIPTSHPEPEPVVESDGVRLFRAFAEGKGEVTRFPESPCPFCGATMGGASAGTDAVPQPEDPTICVKCGGISCFADDLSVRLMTEAEWAEWAEQNPRTYQEAQDASALFRASALRRARRGPMPRGQA